MSASSAVEEHLASLRIRGYTVMASGLDGAFLEELAAKIDAVYALQVEEIGGEEFLEAIGDKDIVRCLATYDEAFVKVACNEILVNAATCFLGSAFVLLQQNGIISRPENLNYQRRWHRDISYQHWTSSRPIALNALLCVDDFTETNGASLVLPGTHLVESFPTEKYVLENLVKVAAPAGSFIVMDAMLFHCAGVNESSLPRRGVNHLIGRPFMAQQIDMPSAFLDGHTKVPDNPSQRQYLGFRWSPAKNALEWRRRRLMTGSFCG
jgi:hypothetical protein